MESTLLPRYFTALRILSCHSPMSDFVSLKENMHPTAQKSKLNTVWQKIHSSLNNLGWVKRILLRHTLYHNFPGCPPSHPEGLDSEPKRNLGKNTKSIRTDISKDESLGFWEHFPSEQLSHCIRFLLSSMLLA